MRIQHNIPALNTYRQLGINNTGSAKSLEKLSSGFKINRAGDDAAGLAISEKMRAQIRGLNRASLNAQDGISLIQAAEGALQESQNILQRMRELAVQAGNDVNEAQDRTYIQDEINQLVKELDRIAFTTEFNKKTLLDGSLQNGNFSAKSISGKGVATGIVVTSPTATAGLYNISTASAGVKAMSTNHIEVLNSVEGETINIAIGASLTSGAGTLIFSSGDVIVTFTATGDTQKDTATAINMIKDVLTKAAGTDYTVTTSGYDLTLTANKAYGSEVSLGSYLDSAAALAFTLSSIGLGTTAAGNSTFTTLGLVSTIGKTTLVSVVGMGQATLVSMSETTYGEFNDDVSMLRFSLNDVTGYTATVVQVTAGRSLTLQVGANSSVDQTVAIGVTSFSATALGVDRTNVINNEAARASLAAVDKALGVVSDQRASLGAVQNRLEHTILNLDTVSENLADAESRIRDTDIAKEMMNFTKYSILMQSAQAMLAQANALPQGVLQLLR